MKGKVTYSNGKTPRVCIIGAGFSGLCAGIQLKRQLSLTSFTIFETNKDVGGTWYTNTYPGCACDVVSHLYSFSFEMKPDWPQQYSSQQEILLYMKNVTEKYGLYPHIKFETQVKSIIWSEDLKKWNVVTVDKNTDRENAEWFDLIINGPGGLRQPNIPEEFKSFKGPMFHSADWNHNIELDNKTVGIVGSGSSAIQIIPNIAKQVKELHVYQRKPAYVVPHFQSNFSGFTKKLFFYVPLIARIYRCLIFLLHELIYPSFRKDHWMGRAATKYSNHHLRSQLRKDENLQRQLTPSFKFGCKRTLVSNKYYPTLTRPNVRVHTRKIVNVSNNGILTDDGNLQTLDVLILATGFRVHDYFAPMEVIGRNSENILNTWRTKIPRSYYGIVGTSAPNHFVSLGPNTGLGHNSGLFMIECHIHFVTEVIREMMKRDAQMVVVKKSAEDEFMSWITKELKNTVWGSTNCGSWYANKDGIITTLWPESCISYWNKTKKVNFSHFEFE